MQPRQGSSRELIVAVLFIVKHFVELVCVSLFQYAAYQEPFVWLGAVFVVREKLKLIKPTGLSVVFWCPFKNIQIETPCG